MPNFQCLCPGNCNEPVSFNNMLSWCFLLQPCIPCLGCPNTVKYCSRRPENKYTCILLSAHIAQICASLPQQMMDSGQDQFSRRPRAITQRSRMFGCFLLSAQQSQDIDLHVLWSKRVKWQQGKINLFLPVMETAVLGRTGSFFYLAFKQKMFGEGFFFPFQTQN